jgi:cell division protein ZapA (FtsZ GTPase activity inhibitor)
MTEPARVELTVLGQTLTLRTDASPEYLRQLVAYVEERVAELKGGGVRDPFRALSLAALDITDELFRARDEHRRDEGDVRSRLGALVTLLERVVPSSGAGCPPGSGLAASPPGGGPGASPSATTQP